MKKNTQRLSLFLVNEKKKTRRAMFQREKMKSLKGGVRYIDDTFLIMRRQRSKSRFMNT